MKPCVIGIGKEMIEIEKSTKEKLHNVRTFHIHFPAYLLQGACIFCVSDAYVYRKPGEIICSKSGLALHVGFQGFCFLTFLCFLGLAITSRKRLSSSPGVC